MSDQATATLDLTPLTRQELADYAAKNHGLTFKPSATKLAIMKAIAEASAPEKKYRVLRPIRHDDERFAVGTIVALKDFQAAPLLNTRTIEVATEEVAL